MIRYRPNMDNIKYSLREEQIFDTVDDMLLYVFDHWSRVVSFMGARKPFRMEEIIISDLGRENALTGWKDEHMILVHRMKDNIFPLPICIGYCGE